MLVETIEAGFPLTLLVDDPVGQLLHALSVQAAGPPLPVDALVDEAAPPQDADVAGNGLVREVER